LGIGICCVKLGRLETAKAAFQRCLELDPSNCEAMVALCLLELNSENTPSKETVQQAMKMLSKAYFVNPNHPMVLNNLANHFFFREEYKKVFPTHSDLF
jgi:RNA polymerase-associated protein CTR9